VEIASLEQHYKVYRQWEVMSQKYSCSQTPHEQGCTVVVEGGNKLLPLLMAVVCKKCHIAFWHSLSLALSEAMIAGEVIQNSGPCEWPLNFTTTHKEVSLERVPE